MSDRKRSKGTATGGRKETAAAIAKRKREELALARRTRSNTNTKDVVDEVDALDENDAAHFDAIAGAELDERTKSMLMREELQKAYQAERKQKEETEALKEQIEKMKKEALAKKAKKGEVKGFDHHLKKLISHEINLPHLQQVENYRRRT